MARIEYRRNDSVTSFSAHMTLDQLKYLPLLPRKRMSVYTYFGLLESLEQFTIMFSFPALIKLVLFINSVTI